MKVRTKLVGAIIAGIATLGVGIGPASAGTNSGTVPPLQGACQFAFNWSGSYMQVTIRTYPPYYAQCGNVWTFGYICGNLNNSYILSVTGDTKSNIAPPNATYDNTGKTQCSNFGAWITNVYIIVKVWGSLNVCWNENAGNWVYNRSDVPCVAYL